LLLSKGSAPARHPEIIMARDVRNRGWISELNKFLSSVALHCTGFLRTNTQTRHIRPVTQSCCRQAKQFNFIVTPSINNIQHFNILLMHTTLKNLELLKHFKIRKAAPTCFGLQGNHHQGTTASTQLKLHTWFKVDT